MILGDQVKLSGRSAKLKRNTIALASFMIAAVVLELDVKNLDIFGAKINGLSQVWIVGLLVVVGIYHAWMFVMSTKDDLVTYMEKLLNSSEDGDDDERRKISWREIYRKSWGQAFDKKNADSFDRLHYRRFWFADVFVPYGIFALGSCVATGFLVNAFVAYLIF